MKFECKRLERYLKIQVDQRFQIPSNRFDAFIANISVGQREGEQLRAALGEGNDGAIVELLAVLEVEPLEIGRRLAQSNHWITRDKIVKLF